MLEPEYPYHLVLFSAGLIEADEMFSPISELMTMSGVYACKNCGQSFGREDDLMDHIPQKHSGAEAKTRSVS